MVVCNFVLPLVLMGIRQFRTITGAVIASIGVVIGMWLERFLIIVPSLGHKYLPYSYGIYTAAAGRDHRGGCDVCRDDAALRAVREGGADHLDLGAEGGRASAGAPAAGRRRERALGKAQP